MYATGQWAASSAGVPKFTIDAPARIVDRPVHAVAFRPRERTLAELKRHRDEVQALRQALEAAQSENLELRRRLGPRHTTRPETS